MSGDGDPPRLSNAEIEARVRHGDAVKAAVDSEVRPLKRLLRARKAAEASAAARAEAKVGRDARIRAAYREAEGRYGIVGELAQRFHLHRRQITRIVRGLKPKPAWDRDPFPSAHAATSASGPAPAARPARPPAPTPDRAASATLPAPAVPRTSPEAEQPAKPSRPSRRRQRPATGQDEFSFHIPDR